MDLSLYHKMIGANNSNVTQAYINDSAVHVNQMFNSSPSYRKILINGEESDGIIRRNKFNQVNFLLRPFQTVDIGSYVEAKGRTYIVQDFIENEIYPKAKTSLCNRFLRWKDDQGNIQEFKCAIQGTTYEEDEGENKKIIHNSDGELTVQVQYNMYTKMIKPQMRFIFDGTVYEVSSIDLTNVYEDKGVLKLVLGFTNTADTDDKEKQVADDSGNSGWGAW